MSAFALKSNEYEVESSDYLSTRRQSMSTCWRWDSSRTYLPFRTSCMLSLNLITEVLQNYTYFSLSCKILTENTAISLITRQSLMIQGIIFAPKKHQQPPLRWLQLQMCKLIWYICPDNNAALVGIRFWSCMPRWKHAKLKLLNLYLFLWSAPPLCSVRHIHPWTCSVQMSLIILFHLVLKLLNNNYLISSFPIFFARHYRWNRRNDWNLPNHATFQVYVAQLNYY